MLNKKITHFSSNQHLAKKIICVCISMNRLYLIFSAIPTLMDIFFEKITNIKQHDAHSNTNVRCAVSSCLSLSDFSWNTALHVQWHPFTCKTALYSERKYVYIRCENLDMTCLICVDQASQCYTANLLNEGPKFNLPSCYRQKKIYTIATTRFTNIKPDTWGKILYKALTDNRGLVNLSLSFVSISRNIMVTWFGTVQAH